MDRIPEGGHTVGEIEVLVNYNADNGFMLTSAGLLRTARKLAEGTVLFRDVSGVMVGVRFVRVPELSTHPAHPTSNRNRPPQMWTRWGNSRKYWQ
ncbi:MAG: hypothetical protein COB40_06995 [Marinosulfonomonas sp.]|nr:MAG: hypothetical protein COB40_06995 [Marinosulfonomonas sp.]